MENGCTTGVKALRLCFKLLDKHTDIRFTGRLMKIVGKILSMDHTVDQNKKAVCFSKAKPLLEVIVFNIRKRLIGYLDYQFILTHTGSRNEARLVADGLKIVPLLIPGGATHFRILHHLSIISDICYSEETLRYEPMSQFNGLSVIGYSDYITCCSRPDIDIVVSFPDGIIPSESDSVIQCFGVEFSQVCSGNVYNIIGVNSIMINKVF